jgi:GT2 family glycosyltransferase
MNAGFITVNYNNAQHTENFVRSIEAAMAGEDFLIVVVDNDSAPADQERLVAFCQDKARVRLLCGGGNIGYFKALNVGLARLRQEMAHPDAVLVGNNDITVDTSFRTKLKTHLTLLQAQAVVSPDIVQENGEHQNPHLLGDVSHFRRLMWDVYHSSYWVGQAVLAMARFSRRFTGRKDHHFHRERGPIAQGYGACYLIGPAFFRHYLGLWAPTLLMQEEYFLYRQLQEIGQEMFYEPDIVVRHHGHASIGAVPSRKIWGISRESHLVFRAFESGVRSVTEFDNLRAEAPTRTPAPHKISSNTTNPIRS